jgi:hypothetical protein
MRKMRIRKISIDASDALMNRRNFERSNTRVTVDPSGAAYLQLFGNTIAEHSNDGTLSISDGDHQSVTTKDRLNALPHVSIYQRDYIWYLNDVQWNGEWIAVRDPALTTPQDDTVEEEIL